MTEGLCGAPDFERTLRSCGIEVNTEFLKQVGERVSIPWLRSRQRVEQTWRKGVMRLARDSWPGATRRGNKPGLGET